MHEIDGAVRQADVVQNGVHFRARNFTADECLDRIAELCGFLDTCSGLGSQMKNEFAVVAAWKEVLSQPRH